MSRALAHRGPDDAGIAPIEANGEVFGSFGHRRLAIIDLSSGGHEPMFTPDRACCLTFNGEIYNYEALKQDLEKEGIPFRSHSDAEVLLMGWWKHGPAFLERLRGMFAFALWDARSARGYLVRDAFGIKPLYVSERNGAVTFSSEVRAMLASGMVPRTLSPSAVATYLSTGSVAEPLTIIDGVRAVPPGCYVEIGTRDNAFHALPPKRFISCFSAVADIDSRSRSHIHRVRNALRDSVRHHLVSDVPVAVFLSGGIDSSAIAGLAAEVSSHRLESFTVTFAEQDYSEAGPAREAARRFNTRHHEIPLSGGDLLSALPDVFAAMDQPSLDGLNTFVVSRAVKEYGIKVVLSGLGGDELFGGYPSFRRARLVSPLWKLPRSIRRLSGTGVRAFRDNRADRVNALLAGENPAFAAYRASRTLFGDKQVRSLTAGRFSGSGFNSSPDNLDMEQLSLLQQVSLLELTGYMRNTLLRDSDVFSMSQGLELRVPFIDLEVARAAASAAAAITSGKESKPVLVDAVRDLLSNETIQRPKKGFTLPFESWLRDSLFDEVDSVLRSGKAEALGLDSRAVASVWTEFHEGRPGVNWSRPWALYTLMRWAQQNGLDGMAEADETSNLSVALSGVV
jgi:asparagine synthase (glutamine-hydrolysing)